MRVFVVVVITAAACTLSVPGFAADGAQRTNPYANLFTRQLNSTQAPQPPPASQPQLIPLPPMPQAYRLPNATVVCGMTVVQDNSKIDPTMPRHPQTTAPTPSIERFPAPACHK